MCRSQTRVGRCSRAGYVDTSAEVLPNRPQGRHLDEGVVETVWICDRGVTDAASAPYVRATRTLRIMIIMWITIMIMAR